MQEPRKVSCTSSPATSLSFFTSSGSLGQHKSGSSISSRGISITAAYSASLSASISSGLSIHFSISRARLSKVFGSWYPSEIIHLSRVIFDCKYSMTGSLSSLTVQPDADLSAEASDSSNACSIFKFGKPSISKHLPEKMFFLFFLSRVRRSCFIA